MNNQPSKKRVISFSKAPDAFLNKIVSGLEAQLKSKAEKPKKKAKSVPNIILESGAFSIIEKYWGVIPAVEIAAAISEIQLIDGNTDYRIVCTVRDLYMARALKKKLDSNTARKVPTVSDEKLAPLQVRVNNTELK
jgi:hypothetical protein